MSTQTCPPPVAKKIAKTCHHHGHTHHDDYAWLRADNWQQVMQEPEHLPDDIRAYLDAENAYAQAQLAPHQALKQTLFSELKGRIKQDDSSVPVKDGAFAWCTRYQQGAEYPQVIRSTRDGEDERVILDYNQLAAERDYFQPGSYAYSPEQKLLVWSYDAKGSEYYTLKIRHIDTGVDYEEEITQTTGEAVFSADGRRFLYTTLNEHHRPEKVFVHTIGCCASTDTLIYHEKDPGFFVGLSQSLCNRYILIDCHSHDTSEVYIVDAADPAHKPQLIAERVAEQEYEVALHGQTLVIRCNAEHADDFKIVTAPLTTPGRAHWQDLIAHQAGCLILSHLVLEDHLVWVQRQNALPQLQVYCFSSAQQHQVSFTEEVYSLGLGDVAEYHAQEIRFTWSSPSTPRCVFDYNVNSRQRHLRKQQEIPSGHQPQDYIAQRLFAPAEDGSEIPITLLRHRNTPLDGSAPCLLYGYGAYGISIPASFDSAALSLVNRGVVCAIAHIRGGSEKGDHWYKSARRENKPRTFSDFICCARMLGTNSLVDPQRIIAEGGSAGGMLMGAIANQAAELFCGIVAVVPFVDVLNTMLDDTLPLTPPEWPEWGNPIAHADDYQKIASWSPYDNVCAQDYPAMLVLAGLTDPRVTYWEPAKWVAKLRECKTDQQPLLFKTNMSAGHAGASGRFSALEETALIHTFILKTLGHIEH